ncbi:MAG: glycosyltransferase, partial [Candidatus Krumholzibacteria bacterium]|nr:glycosyltransferase [Candidatus Krumholzibacteria bacterium]
MKSYRILFFISSLVSGGAEHHLLNLCRFLKSYSHKVAVCTLSEREDGLESTMLLNDINIYRLSILSLRGLAAPRKLIALRRIVKRFQPDLIHSHLYHAEVVSALASLFSGAPLLATRHSEGLEFEGRRRWMVRLIRSRFDSVIAVSRGSAAEAVEMGYPRERVFTVPSGVDTRKFRPLDE